MAVDRTKVLAAAQKHLSKGNYDRAIAEYKKLVDADPRDVRTWLKIGDLYTRKGAHREATETYFRVAEHYATQGFFLKAVAVYKQILKLQPGRLDIQLRLAEMYENLQLVSDALGTYEQVAAAYARDGNIDKALETLGKMAELDPENIPVRIKYAEALSKAGRTDEAADEFEAGAELLREQGRMDDYLKVAERLLFHRPDDVDFARQLAEEYLDRNDAKRALAKLQLCFKGDPKNVETLGLLARAFHLLGQTPKTISVYKEVARLHQEAGRPEERARILQKILELDSGDAEARQALAGYAPSSARRAPAQIDDVPPGALIGSRAEARPAPPAAPPEPSAPPPPEEDDEPELEILEPDDDDILLVEEDIEVDMVVEVDEPVEAPEQAPPVAEPAVSDSMPPDVAREAQVARLLTECEVFARYGLKDKVIAQLERVVEIAPENVEAREKLKDAYVDAGRAADAAEQLVALSGLFEDKPQVAQLYLSQAAELDPAAAAKGLRRSAPPPAMPPPDEPEEATVFDASPFEEDEAPTDQRELPPLPEEPAAEAAPEPGLVADEEDDILFMEDEEDDRTVATSMEDVEAALGVPPESLPAGPELPETPALALEEGLEEATAPPATPSPATEPPAPDAPATVPPDAETGPATQPPVPEPAAPEPAAPVAPEPAAAEQVAAAPEVTPEEAAAVLEQPISPAEFEAAPLEKPDDHVAAARERISIPPGEVEETLDEADFFLAQGLLDAAIATLEDALETHPGHMLLSDKLAEVRQMQAEAEAARASAVPAEPEDEAFALAEKLAEELGEEEVEDLTGSDVLDVDQVFEQFKKGVEEQIGLEDTDTHFDLGIAYKEMGLLDDAIKEFELAMKNPTRECICQTMIGLCLVEQGKLTEGISHFKRGLYAESKSEAEELGLYFELGHAYEMLQDPQEALYYYQKVAKRDPHFRGVDERVQNLTQPQQPEPVTAEPLVLDDVDAAFDDLMGDD